MENNKNLMIRSSSAKFLIFERQTHDKGIQVRFEDGDLWLTQKSIGELFDTTRNNITMHINEIYSTYELEENSTSKKFLLVQKEGNREVKRNVQYCNLDIICDFCNTTSKISNGSIRKLDKTNLTYIEPHRIIIKNITFFAFNYSTDIYIKNLKSKIKLSEKLRQKKKMILSVNAYYHLFSFKNLSVC